MASPRSSSLPTRNALSDCNEKSKSETSSRILDAAEALFIELGFAATSLRSIASRADVNLASAHYHFGSKEGLLGACLHRRIGPINEIGWGSSIGWKCVNGPLPLLR